MSEKTPLLLDVPKDSPSVREARKAQTEAWKKEHNIVTHNAPSTDPNWLPWTAASVSQCKEAVGGYSNPKDTMFDLIANYGRLLDDMNLISYAKTEYEAVKQVVDKLNAES